VTWPLHVANAIYLVSYAVKEIFWLRLITVFAGVLTIVALARMQPSTPRDLMTWQLVFFTINSARFIQLVHERRPVRLPPDARRLAATVFQNLRPRELLRLIEVGETQHHEPGEHVIRQGDALAYLAIVIEGTARVELADQRIVELSHGAFIGELSYLTGKPPAADVIAATALRVVRWPAASLRAYLAENPDTRTAMQLSLGADLAAKLRGTVSSNAS
jgi:cyclic nucleotide-binding protein